MFACVNFVDHLKINHYWNEQIAQGPRVEKWLEVEVWQVALFCGLADETETSMAGQTKSSVARRDGHVESG